MKIKLFFPFFHKQSKIDSTIEQKEEESIRDIPERYQKFPIIKMRQLAEENVILCKISQSKQGVSVENVYAEYIPGKITVAQDKTEWLSFVKGKDVALSFMYGDQLTIFETDLNTLDKYGLSDEPVILKGMFVGEMTAKRLLTKENLSLKDPLTLIKIIEMSDSNSMFYLFAADDDHHIENRLRKIGCNKTADFMEYSFHKRRNHLNSYDEEISEIKKNIVSYYIDWINELEEVKNYQSDPNKVVHGQTDSIDLSVCDPEEIIPFVPIDMPCTQQIRENAVVDYDEPER